MSTAASAGYANFIQEWGDIGGPVAQSAGLPIGAMIAVASVESFWGAMRNLDGTASIFSSTLNPFNLQKWPHIPFPKTHRTF